MEKQLHILKSNADKIAESMIEFLSANAPGQIMVVLIHKAIEIKPTWKSKTYILKDDSPLSFSIPSGVEIIDYSKLVDLIFEADSVVGW